MKIVIVDDDFSNLIIPTTLPDRLIWNAFPYRTSGWPGAANLHFFSHDRGLLI
jgi:hypothetical protein